jgi:hypothetical protein
MSVVGYATNTFIIAFRALKDTAKFILYQSKSGLRKTDRAEITGQKRF